MTKRSFIKMAAALTAVCVSTGLVQAVDEAKLSDGLYAVMDTTQGEIVLSLEFEKSPLTVASFVGLAEGTKYYSKDGGKPVKQEKPYFDGLIFHRIIDGFMIQGGDPTGTGRGGPGYQFKNENDPSLNHNSAGILSMANAGRDTNGSQFFITLAPQPSLNGGYTVFGKTVEGLDVVQKLGKVKTSSNDRPVEEQKIISVKIIRVGEKAEAFKGDEEQFQSLSK